MKKLIFLMMALLPIVTKAIEIPMLPVLTGSQVGVGDTLPFNSIAFGYTAQLALSQLFSIPALQSPTFTGTVSGANFNTAGNIVAGGTLNVTGNTTVTNFNATGSARIGSAGSDSQSLLHVSGTTGSSGATQGIYGSVVGQTSPSSQTIIVGAIPYVTTGAGTTTTNAISLEVTNPAAGAGGSITNATGIYLNNDGTAGTNNYGIWDGYGSCSGNWFVCQEHARPSTWTGAFYWGTTQVIGSTGILQSPNITGNTNVNNAGSIFLNNSGTSAPGFIEPVHNTNSSTAITGDVILTMWDNNVNGTGGSTNTSLRWSHAANAFKTTLSIQGTDASGNGHDIADFNGDQSVTFYGAITPVNIVGTTAGGNAPTGSVGEIMASNPGGAVTPGATTAYVDVTSVTLTPGDWQVTGITDFTAGSSTATASYCGISLTSNAMDALNVGNISDIQVVGSTLGSTKIFCGPRRVNVTVNTPVHLEGRINYTVLGSAVWGVNSYIQAIRMR